MQRLNPIILFLALLVTNCAPSGSREDLVPTTPRSATGGFNQAGIPYVSGSIPEVGKAAQQPDTTPAPQPAKPVTPEKPAQPAQPVQPQQPPQPDQPAQPILTTPPVARLRERLRQFEINRYGKGEKGPSRFGADHFNIKLFFTDAGPTEFNGDFSGTSPHFSISLTSGNYTLQGTFEDKGSLQTKGDLTLTDNTTKDTAHIFYYAYLAYSKILQDRTKSIASGSYFDTQIKNFANTFAWVNDWAVVRGPAFSLTDIIRVVSNPVDNQDAQGGAPLLAFSNPSLQTGEQDIPATVLTPGVSKISMIGNSQINTQRLYQATLSDPTTHDTTDILLQLQAVGEPSPDDPSYNPAPDTSAGDDDSGTPAAAPPASGSFDPGSPPAPEGTEEFNGSDVQRQQRPVRQAPVQNQAAPEFTDNYYLTVDNRQPRTARMSRDFERNRNLPGVRAQLNVYWKGSRHADLQRFYTYANPFRTMIEAIGSAYDVSPSFAYVTVIESTYFIGGNYQIQGNTQSSALGPFQFLTTTASGALHMRVGGSADERRFFAPAACGAGRYIRSIVDEFTDSDATISILGYYQGDGGAARAMVCTKDSSVCSGKNYERYIQLAKNYNLSYATIDNTSAIPKDQRDYVDRKLAVYFISQDIGSYGFVIGSVPQAVQGRAQSTVMPPNAINDATCRQVVAPYSELQF